MQISSNWYRYRSTPGPLRSETARVAGPSPPERMHSFTRRWSSFDLLEPDDGRESSAAASCRNRQSPGAKDLRSTRRSVDTLIQARLWGVIGSTGIPTVLRPSFGNPEGSCEGGRDRWLRRNALAQRCSARQVAEEVMAAFDAQKAEPGLGECSNEYGAGDTGRPAHAAIVTRWMPTNSNSCSGTPSTSRDSAMASRIRSVTTSSERACV